MDRIALLAALAEIVNSGGVEQAQAAQRLIDHIGEDIPGSWDAAAQLADAYLNDPYLTRNTNDA